MGSSSVLRGSSQGDDSGDGDRSWRSYSGDDCGNPGRELAIATIVSVLTTIVSVVSVFVIDWGRRL
jgi:hypothetical protein